MDAQTLQNIQLFDKCRQFTKAREIQAPGLYPYFKPISEAFYCAVYLATSYEVIKRSKMRKDL